MKYSIAIDHKLKLIKYKHAGIIYAEDIENAWGEFLSLPEFTELKYNLFSDYRNGKIEIPTKHLAYIIDFMKQIEPIIRGKKQALILDDPYSVAVSMLFEDKVNQEVGFNVKVFTSPNIALSWLSTF